MYAPHTSTLPASALDRHRSRAGFLWGAKTRVLVLGNGRFEARPEFWHPTGLAWRARTRPNPGRSSLYRALTQRSRSADTTSGAGAPAPGSRMAFRPGGAREGHAVKDARRARSPGSCSPRRIHPSERRESASPIAPANPHGLDATDRARLLRGVRQLLAWPHQQDAGVHWQAPPACSGIRSESSVIPRRSRSAWPFDYRAAAQSLESLSA